MPFTRSIRAWLSWRLAPEMPTDGGRPVRSVIKWIFESYLPRSTGFGPVSPPFFRARMLTESIAQRDQSRSPRAPSSSRIGRGVWPTPWPSTTRRTAGGLWLPTARTRQSAIAATCSPTSQRTQLRPGLPGLRAGVVRRLADGSGPPAPLAGRTPTTHPAPAAQRSHARRLSNGPNEMTCYCDHLHGHAVPPVLGGVIGPSITDRSHS